MKKIDTDEVRSRVRARIAFAGSLRKLAKNWKISPAWLSRFVAGKVHPGEKILESLGLEKTKTTYTERPKSRHETEE